jgi:hypothetical protein
MRRPDEVMAKCGFKQIQSAEIEVIGLWDDL